MMNWCFFKDPCEYSKGKKTGLDTKISVKRSGSDPSKGSFLLNESGESE